MILLIIGFILFSVGIVGALFNMATVFDDKASFKTVFVRHAVFGGLYIVGVVVMIIAGLLLVI